MRVHDRNPNNHFWACGILYYMLKKLIIGNWKMNPKSEKEALAIVRSLITSTKNSKNVEIVICPPFPFFSCIQKLKLKKLKIGAQDMSEESEGAHTGEVSLRMIHSFGVKTIIIGHSERRAGGDTNMRVNKKISLALKLKTIPVLCIGESSRDTTGFYLGFIKDQLHECLAGVPKSQIKDLVIAYEPLWAIGKNALREATPEEFIEMRIFIRRVLSDMYDAKVAHTIPVLYGGSVHPENADAFLTTGEADGLLVGRDSIIPKKFAAIVACVH